VEKAFSYRFYPTAEQESLLRQTLGCVRLVYNRALAARTEAWYERQERIDYVQSSAMLTLNNPFPTQACGSDRFCPP
jgi:putative transposase